MTGISRRSRGQDRAHIAAAGQPQFVERSQIEQFAGGDEDDAIFFLDGEDFVLNQYAGGEFSQKFFGKGNRFQLDVGNVEDLAEQAKHFVFANSVGGENGLIERLAFGQQRPHTLRAGIVEQAFGDESGENGFHIFNLVVQAFSLQRSLERLHYNGISVVDGARVDDR